MELDVVDMEAPMAQQAQVIDRACRDSGFFRIPLACIPAETAAGAWASARAFFAQPEAIKQRVAFPEPGYPYGYSPYRYEKLARSLTGNRDDGDGDDAGKAGYNDAGYDEADLKESFSAGPDCGSQVLPEEAAWVRSPSIWPDHPPGFREAWVRYYRALSDVAARLLRSMAVALELAPEHFDPLIDRHISSMRAIYYPALDHDPDKALRAGAHSDYGTLTILRTDEVPGLEIWRDGGTWEPVTPEPDTFVVNLGDSIARWTNDRWRSTVHRVTATERRPRYSFAFFHMANWDATIKCLPTCLEVGRHSRYQPVRAGPWLMRKFRATVTDPELSGVAGS